MSAYPLTLLHDGACPICRADIAVLSARNHRGLLRFVDISVPGFGPAPYGRTQAELDARIHARRADGQMIEGVEVFRLAYRAVGLRPIAAALGWQPLRPIVDLGYRLFARHRHGLGRALGWAFDAMAARAAARRSQACHGVCKRPTTNDRADAEEMS